MGIARLLALALAVLATFLAPAYAGATTFCDDDNDYTSDAEIHGTTCEY